jgi:hypothetical protein
MVEGRRRGDFTGGLEREDPPKINLKSQGFWKIFLPTSLLTTRSSTQEILQKEAMEVLSEPSPVTSALLWEQHGRQHGRQKWGSEGLKKTAHNHLIMSRLLLLA